MSELDALIQTEINDNGPITVATFMELALGHPKYGYYKKRDPFGLAGDFVTSPEISQVFGELLALWSANCWTQMGSPKRVEIVECGPGRGTLMKDFLRTCKALPDFYRAINIHLVETSPILRDRQLKILKEITPNWHVSLDSVPIGPTILIANEFLDALPIRQLIKTERGWAERRINIVNQRFSYTADNPSPETNARVPEQIQNANTGSIYEYSPAAMEVAENIVRRLAGAPGYALFIDYGHTAYTSGDTLQAMKSHKYAEVLSRPGEADLTAHVNFAAFIDHIKSGGMNTLGPINQAPFLTSIGIYHRTKNLIKNASSSQTKILSSGTERLINPQQMGGLYKVLVATRPEQPPPAGFENWNKK